MAEIIYCWLRHDIDRATTDKVHREVGECPYRKRIPPSVDLFRKERHYCTLPSMRDETYVHEGPAPEGKTFVVGMPLQDFADGGCAAAQLHFQILEEKSGDKPDSPTFTVIGEVLSLVTGP